MPVKKLDSALDQNLKDFRESGRDKGAEMVITDVIKPKGENGPRYHVQGEGDKEFIKMNSNSYLGMSLEPEIINAEEEAAQKYGVGPGAVRFISGTYTPHIELEKKLAEFHEREAGMIFSSAYVTSLGVIYPLIDKETVIISDELNHNCIIQAIRLSRPADKFIYAHNDMDALEQVLKEAVGKGKRCLVVTDGIFSMRGDHAPLDEIVDLCQKYDDEFDDGVISIVDDSHGVGAFGDSGRGTEEYVNTKVDILIGTMGKAFGVNGGYVVTSETILTYLRETAPMYIYSNPITCSETAAVHKVLEYIDTPKGQKRLEHLGKMTEKFQNGIQEIGYETIEGPHPVVPLMVRDTPKTAALVKYLTEKGVLATGLNFPVVPKGDEEIRFQINADHTEADIDYVLGVLKDYKENE